MRRIREYRPFFLPPILLLIFLVFTPPFSLIALGRKEAAVLVEDPRTQWTCLFTELEGSGLDEHNESLRGSIPLLLIEEIEGLPKHSLSEEEIAGRARRLLKGELREAEKKLKSTLGKRDDLVLRGGEESAVRAQEEKIEQLRERILRLSSALEEDAESRVSVYTSLPFQIADDNISRRLAVTPKAPLDLFCREQKADSTVYGKIEQIGEALYLELRLYIADTEKIVPVFEGPIFPEGVEKSTEDAGERLITLLLGREWSHLDIAVEPVHARIALGGEVYAAGKRRIRFLEPGEYEYRVTAPGYNTVEDEIALKRRSVEPLRLGLQPIKSMDIQVETDPAEAELYSKAIPLGTTPVSVEEVVLPFTILVKREGYYEKTLVLTEEPENKKLQIDLHPVEIQREHIIEAARSRFYRGVAGFFLTLPITIVSYGMSTEYAYAFTDSLTESGVAYDQQVALRDAATLWYTAYLGGLFLNGVFLIDSIIGMTHYIRAAEGGGRYRVK
jgi:hypothetical protein